MLSWDFMGIYPLVMTNIAIENGRLKWISHQDWRFSIVKLPEGIYVPHKIASNHFQRPATSIPTKNAPQLVY